MDGVLRNDAKSKTGILGSMLPIQSQEYISYMLWPVKTYSKPLVPMCQKRSL